MVKGERMAAVGDLWTGGAWKEFNKRNRIIITIYHHHNNPKEQRNSVMDEKGMNCIGPHISAGRFMWFELGWSNPLMDINLETPGNSYKVLN